MKRILTLSALFLFVLFGNFSQGSDIALPDAAATPQIQVTKKSNLVRPSFFKFFLTSALNTLTGDSLVVWHEDEDFSTGLHLKGRILNKKGNKTPKKLPSNPPVHYKNDGVGVAFNPHTLEFLLVYARDFAIVGQRLDGQAKEIGQEFEIIPATVTNSNVAPQIVFNAQTNGYSLIWRRTEGISTALLDQSGKVSGSIVIIKKNLGTNGYYDPFPQIHDIGFLSSGNKLLVLIQSNTSRTHGDYWLATLDPLLKVNSSSLARINKNAVEFPPEEFIVTSSTGYGACLGILQDGSALVVYGDKISLKRRKIDQNGKLAGKSSPAFSAQLKKELLYNPKVVFSTTLNGTAGLMIATQAEFKTLGTVWAQALDSKGRPVGAPVEVNEALPGFYTNSSDLIALPRAQSDSVLQFIWLQSQIYHPYTGEQDYGRIVKVNLDLQP